MSSPSHSGSKYYYVEKAISRGRLGELCGLALMSKIGNELRVRWDQVVELALLKLEVLLENELKVSA